jgi:hydrogenase expression/formation protein HypE
LADLKTIVKSMAEEAKKAGVLIVTGDTKVVNKGKCDKIFINTSGIGILNKKHKNISSGKNIKTDDKIIINGTIGDHGMAILSARNELNIKSNIVSDCACLNYLIEKALSVSSEIKFMRDATRGIQIDESSVKVKEEVRGMCEILGFDPLYVANEGKVLIIVGSKDAEKVLKILKQDELGKDSTIIGEIVDEHPGKSWITTGIGGKRIIDMLTGEQLPRIC